MSKAKKTTRQERDTERKERRYRAIRNRYGDVKLANKARGWSNERIFNELGVRVPKSLPKLKPLPTAEQLKTKQRDLARFQESVKEIGLTPKKAVQLKRYSKRRRNTSKEYYNEIAKPVDNSSKARSGRAIMWAQWSDDALPPEIHHLAKEINRATVGDFLVRGQLVTKRLDDTDHYGYAVAYLAFVNRQTPDEVMQYFKPAKDLNDSGQYVRQNKRTRRAYA